MPASRNVVTIDRLGAISGSYIPQVMKIRSTIRRGRARYALTNLTTGSKTGPPP